MAYLGRKGAVAPLTSADIPVGIVEGTDIAFLGNASGTQNLGGTYSTERMYLNDSYTLTGDVTITGHLALGSVADSDVVITNDSSARTITGSGTLDGGNVLQDTHRTSVTGMTGELGSAVTGSPNLNLSNATFPAGHIIQITSNTKLDTFTTNNIDVDVTGFTGTITPKVATSKIFVMISCTLGSGTSTTQGHLRLKRQVASGSFAEIGGGTATGDRVSGIAQTAGSESQHTNQVGYHFLDSPSFTLGQVINYKITASGQTPAGNYNVHIGKSRNDANADYQSYMPATVTLMEIAQ